MITIALFETASFAIGKSWLPAHRMLDLPWNLYRWDRSLAPCAHSYLASKRRQSFISTVGNTGRRTWKHWCWCEFHNLSIRNRNLGYRKYLKPCGSLLVLQFEQQKWADAYNSWFNTVSIIMSASRSSRIPGHVHILEKCCSVKIHMPSTDV